MSEAELQSQLTALQQTMRRHTHDGYETQLISVTSTTNPGVSSVTNDTNVTGTVTGNILTLGWTGQLGVSRGGTGASTLTNHGVVIGAAGAAVNVTSAGTAGQVLTSNGASSDPTFQSASATNPTFSATAGENLNPNDAVFLAQGVVIDNTISQTQEDTHARPEGANWIAQTFKTSASAVSLISVSLFLDKLGTPGSTAHLYITPTSGGAPSGAALVDYLISPATISAAQEYTFTFASPVVVSGSTTYAAILAYGNADVSNNFGWYYKNSNVYADGAQYESGDSGSTWNPDVADAYFKINQSYETTGKIYRTTSASNNEKANNFIGFVTTTTNAGASATATVDGVVSGFSNLATGVTYYLNDSAGTIGSSAGSVSRKIGLSVSATQVLIKHDNP